MFHGIFRHWLRHQATKIRHLTTLDFLPRLTLSTVMLGLAAFILSACGFHLPNQARLNETMPEINVVGDYHENFYKMVVNRLRANGVTVHAQSSSYDPLKDNNVTSNIPLLMIPAPTVTDTVVSVNSLAQSIENAIVVSTATTLSVANHRPILMRNSITRSTLNKTGQALASDTEKATIILETEQQLADELVLRLSYLGRSSDPDAPNPMPYELLMVPGEDPDGTLNSGNIPVRPGTNQNMTLLEALQLQEQYEKTTGRQVTLDEINNGNAILDPNKSYQLPPVKPQPLNQIPVSR